MQLISGGLEFSGSVLTLNLIKEPLNAFAARFNAGALARDSVTKERSTAVEPTAVLN